MWPSSISAAEAWPPTLKGTTWSSSPWSLSSALTTPRLERELKLGQLAAAFPELSRVVSRTGPQHKSLSEIP
jgi:hypothetical protein